MQAGPLVSILITSYNYGLFLREAIDSALNQTYSNIEVVVIDDGSTDNSLEIIDSYRSRIVKVAKQNGGQGSAFNVGFEKCKGELICLLDSDDLFALGKVARVVQIFGENADIGWCWDVERKFEDRTGERLPHDGGTTWGRLDARQLMVDGTPPGTPTACSGMSFRRETLARILPMPESFKTLADGYVKLAALALSEGWFEPEELTLQRVHRDNMYTHQKPSRRRRQAGRAGLLLGVYFQERFPTLNRTAVHMLTRGLGMCWATGGVDSDCKPLLDVFLDNLTLQKRYAVVLKATYWSARGLLRL
jgi:glycosyltransferase involved in cell wall biosynthesis